MRKRVMTIFAALVLASVGHAGAQNPPTKPVLPAEVPTTGLFDAGFRGNSVDGDQARYERFRDPRNGATTLFAMAKNTDRYRFNANFSNAGYRDQRYAVEYNGAKVAVSGLYDGIPLNYLYDAPLAWTAEGNGRFTLDPALRARVEGPTNAPGDGTAVGVPCAPGLGPTTCNGSTSAQAIANRSIYNNFLTFDDMSVLRSIAAVSLTYRPGPAVAIRSDFMTTGRDGEMPWAASFAFTNANLLPAPVDHRNNELRLNTEWVNTRGMFRVEYWGSFFDNGIQALTWDNPIRATDFNNGLPPPNGPYDPAGYSNGNGPALGQLALWPSNMLNSAGATGMFKLLPRTTVNGNVTLTYMRQDESLLPWSLNTSINNEPVLNAFPALRQLPRTSADAKVNALNAQLTVNSRPTSYLTLTGRYRYNDHDNNTPHFDARQYVRLDSLPGQLADDPLTEHVEGLSEYFQITRKNLDASGTFRLRDFGSLKVGYANEQFDREGRGFSDVSENIFRLAYDANLFQRASVRVLFDTGQRRGDGYIISGVDYESGPAGTQPGLRYFDEADRDRTKASVVFSVNPIPRASTYVQYTTTRDEFFGDESIPAGREFFGLQTQDIDGVVIGADFSATDVVSFGVSYGRDEFSAFQKSRNSNPPPDPSWTDPNRNWTLDNDEVVNTFLSYLDLSGLAQSKLNARFSYERNDSDNAFTYGGPRIPALQAAGQFIPLPNVVNEWNRFTLDGTYFVTPKVGLGVAYWYEKLSVTDWSTIDSNGPAGFVDATGTPRIDWLGGLMTGYGNRPYEGNTFFVRALVRF
jgi:MtrB/PioB family decaheme-associated outer membrane protein